MFSKYIKNPNSKIFSRKKKGFSFLEVMLSVFIFSLMMTTVSMTFASLFKNYTKAKAIQKNLENSQFAMNSMAKSLRTSSIISYADTNIKFFNYSDGTCTAYRFQENSLQVASAVYPPASLDKTSKTMVTWCTNLNFLTDDYLNIISSNVNDVIFDVVPSLDGAGVNPNVIGKVTVSVEVCATPECAGSVQDRARIQSSVSLRDYNTVGF